MKTKTPIQQEITAQLERGLTAVPFDSTSIPTEAVRVLAYREGWEGRDIVCHRVLQADDGTTPSRLYRVSPTGVVTEH